MAHGFCGIGKSSVHAMARPNYREITSPVPNCRAYIALRSQCTVFVAVEAGKWHLSIAHRHRYPSWEEIKQARYEFVPDDVTMAMLLPPMRQFVSVHPNCFHLHQIANEAD